MTRRAEYLLHTISEIKHKISDLQGYLEYLQKELEKEVSGEVKK